MIKYLNIYSWFAARFGTNEQCTLPLACDYIIINYNTHFGDTNIAKYPPPESARPRFSRFDDDPAGGKSPSGGDKNLQTHSRNSTQYAHLRTSNTSSRADMISPLIVPSTRLYHIILLLWPIRSSKTRANPRHTSFHTYRCGTRVYVFGLINNATVLSTAPIQGDWFVQRHAVYARNRGVRSGYTAAAGFLCEVRQIYMVPVRAWPCNIVGSQDV